MLYHLIIKRIVVLIPLDKEIMFSIHSGVNVDIIPFTAIETMFIDWDTIPHIKCSRSQVNLSILISVLEQNL